MCLASLFWKQSYTQTHTCVKSSYKLKQLTKVNLSHGHSLA